MISAKQTKSFFSTADNASSSMALVLSSAFDNSERPAAAESPSKFFIEIMLEIKNS